MSKIGLFTAEYTEEWEGGDWDTRKGEVVVQFAGNEVLRLPSAELAHRSDDEDMVIADTLSRFFEKVKEKTGD